MRRDNNQGQWAVTVPLNLPPRPSAGWFNGHWRGASLGILIDA